MRDSGAIRRFLRQAKKKNWLEFRSAELKDAVSVGAIRHNSWLSKNRVYPALAVFWKEASFLYFGKQMNLHILKV